MKLKDLTMKFLFYTFLTTSILSWFILSISIISDIPTDKAILLSLLQIISTTLIAIALKPNK